MVYNDFIISNEIDNIISECDIDVLNEAEGDKTSFKDKVKKIIEAIKEFIHNCKEKVKAIYKNFMDRTKAARIYDKAKENLSIYTKLYQKIYSKLKNIDNFNEAIDKWNYKPKYDIITEQPYIAIFSNDIKKFLNAESIDYEKLKFELYRTMEAYIFYLPITKSKIKNSKNREDVLNALTNYKDDLKAKDEGYYTFLRLNDTGKNLCQHFIDLIESTKGECNKYIKELDNLDKELDRLMNHINDGTELNKLIDSKNLISDAIIITNKKISVNIDLIKITMNEFNGLISYLKTYYNSIKSL